MVAGGVPWLVEYAGRKGFRYSPEADERWLRAWEPYATLRVPVRYEHVLESTGDVGSLTVARVVVASGASAWIPSGQDARMEGRDALTREGGRAFAEPLDLVTLPRTTTGDAPFDAAFATFAAG